MEVGLEKTLFSVTARDLFEQEIWTDTVEGPVTHFTLYENEGIILEIRELGTKETSQLFLAPKLPPLPTLTSRVDSLNHALLNGHFFHAVALFYKMNRPDLVQKLIPQYNLMFHSDYPPTGEMFNSYFDIESNDLVQMPYIAKHGFFIQQLRRSLKGSGIKGTLRIEATLGANNSIEGLVITPPVNPDVVLDALSVLEIDLHSVEHAKLILIVNAGPLQWRLLNLRALTDPLSPGFKANLTTARGAVHR